ncbi:MAG: type II secretion system F family protein [Phycisphaerae bacterium]|nr:type II secretion system F family protein [Phycisphaerae bacterium]
MADSRINLYHNLSVMLDAGIPITRTLQTVHKRGKYGRLFKQIEQAVSAGSSLTDVVEAHKRQFKQLDRTLIEVGEQTGQSAEMFEELSQWYAFRQRMLRIMKSGLILPVFYIHAAAFLVPFIGLIRSGWDTHSYFQEVLMILGIFYIPLVIILGIIHLTPQQGPLRWLLDIFVMLIPVFRKGIRELELSRYSKVFSITYKAGIPIVEAARMATDAVTNLVMRHQLKGAQEKVKVGDLMSSGFSRSLPGEFLGIWQVGEESGDMDESARRLADIHADNAENYFTVLAKITPLLLYFIILGLLAFFIVTTFLSFYSQALSI